MPEPTAKQIHYLYDLGYDGLRPLTMDEASAAIDAMKKTGDEQDAEQAIRAIRRLHGTGCFGSLASIVKTVVTLFIAVVVIC